MPTCPAGGCQAVRLIAWGGRLVGGRARVEGWCVRGRPVTSFPWLGRCCSTATRWSLTTRAAAGADSPMPSVWPRTVNSCSADDAGNRRSLPLSTRARRPEAANSSRFPNYERPVASSFMVPAIKGFRSGLADGESGSVAIRPVSATALSVARRCQACFPRDESLILLGLVACGSGTSRSQRRVLLELGVPRSMSGCWWGGARRGGWWAGPGRCAMMTAVEIATVAERPESPSLGADARHVSGVQQRWRCPEPLLGTVDGRAARFSVSLAGRRR